MVRKVAFLHPDLGIGGAERLVVDAAVGLQGTGYQVVLYTSHCDPKHAFKETQDGTLQVKVHGDWLPRHLFGRLHALCALLRMFYLTFILILSGLSNYDAVFVDVLSGPIPFLRMLGVPVLFYCHYPDKLLCVDRTSFLKRLYRAPLDWIEEKTTGMALSSSSLTFRVGAASRVLVNSQFTAGVYASAFPHLAPPHVLYPPVNLSQVLLPSSPLADFPEAAALQDKRYFLSINRYERKKNIALAIQAFAHLIKTNASNANNSLSLVIAGGYDERVTENVEHLTELRNEARRLGVESRVLFLISISQQMKVALMRSAEAVIYTPSNEHFGIVPVESMAVGTPVIATNSGGPLESIKHGVTGFLAPAQALAFAEHMSTLISDPSVRANISVAAPQWVQRRFTLDVFATFLCNHLAAIARTTSVKKTN